MPLAKRNVVAPSSDSGTTKPNHESVRATSHVHQAAAHAIDTPIAFRPCSRGRPYMPNLARHSSRRRLTLQR
jgi:hypothetical protein